MPGFKRIDLNNYKDEKKGNKNINMSLRKKKNIRRIQKIAVIILVILLLAGVFIGIPAYQTIKAARVTYARGKLIASAMKQQNVELASAELKRTKQSLTETRKSFDRMFFVKFIPVINFYYNDADHALNAGKIGLDTAEKVIDSLKPYADVLGLKGANATGGSAEDKIKTAVMTMGKITPQIDSIADQLLVIQKDIDAINPKHYPVFIFGKKPQEQLTQLRQLTDQSVELVDQARPLIKVLPSLLGESEPKKYLILFQNDKELRPTGGFITGYSIMRIDKGKLTAEKSDDIYPLDDTIRNKPVAPAPILKYLAGVDRFNLRDSNISADFIESMKTFRSLYNQASGSEDVDGIIAIDTNVLVSTIRILDDQVSASGITFTSQKDPRCDCPQVIYELEDNISRPVDHFRPNRKGLIGSLVNAIMDKALSSSPKQYWGPLFQTMLMETNQKHILFYLFDSEAQKGIEAMNAAGRIADFEGDYLHINDTNFGGQKANLFTTESVQNEYNIDNSGKIEKTLTITYKNTFPPSDCSLEAGKLCLNAPLRNWIRVYVPKGSELIESKGSEVKLKTYDELGKTVFEGFFIVRPEGQAKFTLKYRLPFSLAKGSVLPVLIQKQPGTNGNEYTVSLNGNNIQNFNLFADKKLQLNNPR